MSRLQRTNLELKLMAEEFVELLKEQKPEPKEKREGAPAEAELATAKAEA
jgi:hypothetical protein